MKIRIIMISIIALSILAFAQQDSIVMDSNIENAAQSENKELEISQNKKQIGDDKGPIECYVEANQLYKQEQFGNAIDLYEQAIDDGLYDACVYYNLGNTYFKNENIAHAIIAYERAFFLNPRDEDIQNNLDYARLYTPDKISSIYQGSFIGTFWTVIRMVTYHELKITIIIITAIATLLLFIHLIRIKSKKRVLLRLSILFFIIGLLATGLYVLKLNDNWLLESAIVTATSVDVQSSPTESGELLFTLHPGTKVVIKEEYGQFLRVSIQDGREGWLPEAGVTRIFPKES
ncbi:MAG: tetratricopeptide repeat protein [Candidatus Zixiibacteriota bacterium]